MSAAEKAEEEWAAAGKVFSDCCILWSRAQGTGCKEFDDVLYAHAALNAAELRMREAREAEKNGTV